MTEETRKPQWATQPYWQDRFVEGNTPWELNAPSSVVIEALDELQAKGFDLMGKCALSPGCGRGSDALELVRRGAKVTAIDWSEMAVESLRQRYGTPAQEMPGSLEVIQGNFFDIPARPVDIACEHTFFCAIDPAMRPRYVDAMVKWVKPGGYLVGNFFVVSEEEVRHLPNRSLTKEGQGPPFAATVKELEGLFSQHFVIRMLRPAKRPEANRRSGVEWVGILERSGGGATLT